MCKGRASQAQDQAAFCWCLCSWHETCTLLKVTSPPVPPSLSERPAGDARQRIVKVRRDYNTWVGNETLEDYALRYTPLRFRRWSVWWVAHTAFGASSFLILEAVGATLLVQHGAVNAFWAIAATGVLIALAGTPISVYAARYGVDMDLLTRGAGFGYIGSTLTSLIYACFTFIFFALEAAVMAYALELALDVPPTWGYLICALVVVPMVTHGVSVIGRLQVWTQALWLVLLIVPYVAVAMHAPSAFTEVLHYKGELGQVAGFDVLHFGAALTVGIALMTQMGEQADYLRFMPPAAPVGHTPTRRQRLRWWAAVLLGGPGWIVPGVLKMSGGALLAYLALSYQVPPERAVDPNQMYVVAYNLAIPHYGWAVAVTALFVVVSQLKINVTNAYAGSLAWSNFFSRLTHSHPGRVVWVVFNALIAFMLMQMSVFQALGQVLGLYANIAIAWLMAVVADLLINKPLGLSPAGIEFKRAHLYDINPVGVGAMLAASGVSMVAHLGLLGPVAQAFSALIALVTALVVSPVLAWATQGRYYIARAATPPDDGGDGAYLGGRLQRCVICEREYEAPDMAHCPAYQGRICSLCCTLDARCGDGCKPHARLSVQWQGLLQGLLPRRSWPYLEAGLAHYLLLMLAIAPLLAGLLSWLYHPYVQGGQGGHGFAQVYAALLLVLSIIAWWLVLAHRSREVAQQESKRQNELLLQEIASHRQTDAQLQQAREAAERARAAAEHANHAKSRYISTISHELRTPLNSILGYAQMLHEDASLGPQRAHAVKVIHRGGEHLLSLIEGTLDIARIESGKLQLHIKPTAFAEEMQALADLFDGQAKAKGLRFRFEAPHPLPAVVRVDERRLRQILINLLGNAVKFTQQGDVVLRVVCAREMAQFEVQDSGCGMSSEELERVFEPFARGHAAQGNASGTGLGLTIAKMLTDVMGGELTVRSKLGQGTTFKLRLFLPQVQTDTYQTAHATHSSTALPPSLSYTGYAGPRRHLLIVDNEESDRELMQGWLLPLGFDISLAVNGHDALTMLAHGLHPDAVLMDLAMPGIDGWETLRRLRIMVQDGAVPDMACAIVSANAFDQQLPNDVGITPADFLVKPVRRSDVLHWLERQLKLTWISPPMPPMPSSTTSTTSTTPTAPSPVAALVCPSAPALGKLLHSVQLGHLRGIERQLQHIASTEPACAGFVAHALGLLQTLSLDTLESWLLAQHNDTDTPTP